MHRAFAAVLLFTMVCGNVACSHREQLRKEASLQESLGVLRRGIKQFTLDHARPPTSLSELMSAMAIFSPIMGNRRRSEVQQKSSPENRQTIE
jgi:hypothetical protein